MQGCSISCAWEVIDEMLKWILMLPLGDWVQLTVGYWSKWIPNILIRLKTFVYLWSCQLTGLEIVLMMKVWVLGLWNENNNKTWTCYS